MSDRSRQKQIEDVRREESSRGRKHYDSAEAARQSAERARLLALLESGTEAEFIAAIIARGLRRGSPEFENALALFRAARQRRP